MADDKLCGIYRITNKISKSFYIGSSIDIVRRWRKHAYDLNAGRHCNAHFQNSWAKHGEASFTFDVIEQCRRDDLPSREQFHITAEQPTLNITHFVDRSQPLPEWAEPGVTRQPEEWELKLRKSSRGGGRHGHDYPILHIEDLKNEDPVGSSFDIAYLLEGTRPYEEYDLSH